MRGRIEDIRELFPNAEEFDVHTEYNAINFTLKNTNFYVNAIELARLGYQIVGIYPNGKGLLIAVCHDDDRIAYFCKLYDTALTVKLNKIRVLEASCDNKT